MIVISKGVPQCLFNKSFFFFFVELFNKILIIKKICVHYFEFAENGPMSNIMREYASVNLGVYTVYIINYFSYIFPDNYLTKLDKSRKELSNQEKK